MVRLVSRSLEMLAVATAGLAIIACGISRVLDVGPVLYDWDLRLPSPDGRYDLVVLRGDAAAFDDFSYHVYLFPHSVAPADRPRGTQIRMTSIWRDRKSLVYSGYNYPMFRWTGPGSVEFNLTDSLHRAVYVLRGEKDRDIE